MNLNTATHGRMASSSSVLLWLVQHGPHGDKGKVVRVGESLMNREVKGLP